MAYDVEHLFICLFANCISLVRFLLRSLAHFLQVVCFLIVNFLKKLTYFLAALGLGCCVRAFSSCGKWGLLFIAVCRLLICGGFSCCGARALGAWASVVVVRRLSNCGSWAL